MKHVFYSILITLLLFCPKSASAIIEITGVTPAHSASMSSPPDCSGSIDLTATGNAGPFTFQWSNGATTEDINGLCKGTYYVTVTNNFGCTKVLSATVQD